MGVSAMLCKGRLRLLSERANFATPGEVKAASPAIDLKFCIIDYMGKISECAKLG
jgi:hypothetical protein